MPKNKGPFAMFAPSNAALKKHFEGDEPKLNRFLNGIAFPRYFRFVVDHLLDE